MRYPAGNQRKVTVDQLAGHLGEIKADAKKLREALYEEDQI